MGLNLAYGITHQNEQGAPCTCKSLNFSFWIYLPFPVSSLLFIRSDCDILQDLQEALRIGMESKPPHIPISAPNVHLYLILDLQQQQQQYYIYFKFSACLLIFFFS